MLAFFMPYIAPAITVLLLIVAIVAVIYVPSPFKHYVIDAAIIGAVAAQLYTFGYEAAKEVYEAQLKIQQQAFDLQIDDFNTESEKAVLAATAKVKAEEEANTAAIKKALDEQAAAATASDAVYKAALGEISKAQGDADQPAPRLIIEAIGAK